MPQARGRTENRRVVRRPLAGASGGGTLRLTFRHIKDEDGLEIWQTYKQARSTYGSVILPPEIFAGDPDLEAFTSGTNGEWRFSRPPVIEWIVKGCISVEVELIRIIRQILLGPPNVIDAPPIRTEPQFPDPGPIPPPPPDEDNPNAVTAFFRVTAPTAEDAYLPGFTTADYIEYNTAGIIQRTDAPGYVETVNSSTNGIRDANFIGRQPDGTVDWHLSITAAGATNETYETGFGRTRLDGKYVFSKLWATQGVDNVEIIVVNSDGSGATFHEFVDTWSSVDYVDTTTGFAFLSFDSFGGNSNSTTILKVDTNFNIIDQKEFTFTGALISICRVECEVPDGSGDIIITGEYWTQLYPPYYFRNGCIMRIRQDFSVVWQKDYVFRPSNRVPVGQASPQPEDYYQGGARYTSVFVGHSNKLIGWTWNNTIRLQNNNDLPEDFTHIFEINPLTGEIVGTEKYIYQGIPPNWQLIVPLTLNYCPDSPVPYLFTFESYNTPEINGTQVSALDLNFNVQWTWMAQSYYGFSSDTQYYSFFFSYDNNIYADADLIVLNGEMWYGPADLKDSDGLGSGCYTVPFLEAESDIILGEYGVDPKGVVKLDWPINTTTSSDLSVSNLTVLTISAISRITKIPGRSTVVTPSTTLQEKLYPFRQPPSLDGAVPIVPANIVYTQSSVYPLDQILPATVATMQNNTGNETQHTATDDTGDNWVQMDFGVKSVINSIVVGCDYNNLLGTLGAGGWGPYYTEQAKLEYSVDGVNWFRVVLSMGTFSAPTKSFSGLSIAGRYVRLNSPYDYLAVTEFSAS